MKNILYLDEKKLFSLTSQVFAGVTEFLIKEKSTKTTDSETQKGPLASGKVVADAITSGEKDTERRVMHDYAFSLFESEILKKDLVQEITLASSFIAPNLEQPFVKISAPAHIFDVRKAQETMEKFNALAESLGYIQSKEVCESATSDIANEIKTTKDKQKANALSKQKDQMIKAIVSAASESMSQDQKYLDHMVNITRFGFNDSLEVHQTVDAKRFTSFLKRECLREDESLLVRKYSRMTKMNFVVLGMITNYPEESPPSTPESMGDDSEKSMKEAFIGIVRSLGNFEKTFSDVDKREYMIDPVAIYVTLGTAAIT
ncbi:hypothetical protein J2W28_000063 [Variovorax boronicumulans]|uniref:DUF6414 family protein n=1 Tax=Variovorax boronicumulans TaxID=436515 RepID=UPI002785C3B4|nr:hypothetical protein [Variovorax boronicumulans]MDP9990554.1 hypothetical protein [Variovorax boronicumulans]MDQ0000935.1 hypothetical protein [Variovorax boronicumulans]